MELSIFYDPNDLNRLDVGEDKPANVKSAQYYQMLLMLVSRPELLPCGVAASLMRVVCQGLARPRHDDGY